MKRFIERFKKRRQFKRNMVNWIKLCKCKKSMSKIIGIVKVGELTHSISIDGIGEISTRDPIFISHE